MKTFITTLYTLCAITLCLGLSLSANAQSLTGNATFWLTPQYQATITTNGVMEDGAPTGQLCLTSGMFSVVADYTSIQTVITSKGVKYAVCAASGLYFLAGSLTPMDCTITIHVTIVPNGEGKISMTIMLPDAPDMAMSTGNMMMVENNLVIE